MRWSSFLPQIAVTPALQAAQSPCPLPHFVPWEGETATAAASEMRRSETVPFPFLKIPSCIQISAESVFAQHPGTLS